MKKNRMMRLASILLVCVLLSTSVISGTFAKYISEAHGEDMAYVAKWQIDVGETNIATEDTIPTEDTITFNLFETIQDYGESGSGADENVSNGRIAPGTRGSFSVQITNKSEVDAKIQVYLTAEETNGYDIPIQYSKTGTGDWVDDLNKLSFTQAVVKAGDKTTDDVTVYWQWVYGDGDVDKDTADTALGIAAADGKEPAVIVEMYVTATQVD